MEDRKASIVAAAFGSAAIGGFWLARPIAETAPLRVLEQWVPVVRKGGDEDVAVAFRVDFRKGQRKAQEEGRTVEFRVVDRDRREYPLVPLAEAGVPNGLKLQKGYVRRIEAPRLAAFANGEMLASVPIGSLPEPESVALVPGKSSALALVYHPGGGIFVEPKRRLARDERWRVFARRTPSSPRLSAVAVVTPRIDRSPSRRLAIPYPHDTKAVDVEFVRYRMVPRSDVVRVSSLRLERRFGGTALIVDRRTRIPNRLAADIVLPAQNNGPRRPLQHDDPRVAFANLFTGRRGTTPLRPPLREMGPFVEILSPSPESLGLRELRVGGGVLRAKGEPRRAVRTGSFTATLRISYFHAVPIGSLRTVLPVVSGAPMPPMRSFGASWGAWAEF